MATVLNSPQPTAALSKNNGKMHKLPKIRADRTCYFIVRSIEYWTVRKSDKYSDQEACSNTTATGRERTVVSLDGKRLRETANRLSWPVSYYE
jgi:hypothetical protein